MADVNRERERRPRGSSCASAASDRIALSPRQFALFRPAEQPQTGAFGTMLTRTTTNWTDNDEPAVRWRRAATLQKQFLVLW